MSLHSRTTRTTAPQLRARKGGEPLVCLTAYDAPTAALLDPHCDLILVGDTVGMVVHGMTSTLGVTLDMMVMHGKAVMRGAERAMVVVDMPFGSYEESPQVAFANASRLMMETGCQAVKLESGAYTAETIAFLTERGIPVMAHVGLRPQSVNILGGFKAQGRNDAERAAITADAEAACAAGAFAMVVEGVAEDLARTITQAVACPTVGIGASAVCDGQILVTPDMLGLFEWTPKFVKRYGDLRGFVADAAAAYAADVKARRFPGDDHVYRLKDA